MSDTPQSPKPAPQPGDAHLPAAGVHAGAPTPDDILVLAPKPGDPAAPEPEPAGFVLLTAQLFLIPLVIVAICVGVFVLFGWMATDQRTGMELLTRIEDYAGADNKMTPWMSAAKNEAALQLMLLIRSGDRKLYDGARGHPRGAGGATDRDAFEAALVAAFARLQQRDPGAAGILARAIAHIGRPEGKVALREAVHSPDRELRFECVWALAALRDLESYSTFTELSADPDSGCRMLSAWALGNLGDPTIAGNETIRAGRLLSPSQIAEAVEKIKPLLADAVEEVRWNAAAALACLGDDSGVPVLLGLLEKGHIERLTEAARNEAKHPLHRKSEQVRKFGVLNMTSALMALDRLISADAIRDPAVRKTIAERVRQAAQDGTLDPVVQQEAGKLMRKLS